MVLSYADGLPYKYPVMVRSYTNLIEVMDITQNIEKDIVICNGTAGWRGEKRQQEGLFESSKKKKCHQEKKSCSSSIYMRCHSSHKGSCKV